MDRKYQVFISSTYADLREERNVVTKTVMELDHIPVGMETFPAVDEEQWAFIQKLIDETDYYIVVVAGRYGSMDEDGMSYTEKEYDYAVKNGVPVLALLHENPAKLPMDKSEGDPDVRAKLDTFRKKLMTGRLIKFWSDENGLAAAVATSLPKQMKTYPRTGWVRADAVAEEEVLKENFRLRKENERLQAEVNRFQESEFFEDLLTKEVEFEVIQSNVHPARLSKIRVDIRSMLEKEGSYY